MGVVLNITQENILGIIIPCYGLTERVIVGVIYFILKIRENETTPNIKGPFSGA